MSLVASFSKRLAWLLIMTAPACVPADGKIVLSWRKLRPLPDPIGFAGAYAGTSGGALIVAGGANFPDQPPWEGGTKAWHDSAFVLERPGGEWKTGFRLARPSAYGVSVTAKEGVVCVGGSDERRHLTNVSVLRWDGRSLQISELPGLPVPLANSCGALLGRHVYVAGGTDSPAASNTLHAFLRLDLDRPAPGWEKLPTWPGRPRMLATAAAVDGSFFIAGGTDLHPDRDGKPARTYLRDAYRFTPGKGWARIADLPNAVVAAPSPAPVLGSGFLLVGGDDGTLAGFNPPSAHPGFPKSILHYDARKNEWRRENPAPFSRATLPTAQWRRLQVMPSGESRPGVRSPEVWALQARGSR